MHQEVVDALIETRAVDFEAVGNVLAKFGARAGRSGSGLGVIINWRLIDLCIPPDPYLGGRLIQSELGAGEEQLGG